MHDLATPITGLSARLYLLQRTPERLNEHVRALENQIQHLRNLLDDLRTLSRIDRGQLTIKRVPCAINDLVQRVFDTYEPVAAEKGQTFTLKLDRSLVTMQVDPRQIERLLVNLIANAVNYTPEGRSIAVETSSDEGRSVVIRVEDTGIGISADDLPHIFDRFFRAPDVRERFAAGTGLGLAIAREIVTLHGGTIDVTSEPGAGSTFTIRLPIAGDSTP